MVMAPPSGFVVNANHTPFWAAGPGSEMNPADYSPLLGIERNVTNRGTRSIELMAADSSISRAELEAIKYDTAVSRRSWAGGWFDGLLKVDDRGNDQVRAAKALLARWDWNYDGRGPADAIAVLLLREGNRCHYRNKECVTPFEGMKRSAEHLAKHFGRLDPPLGELLRLRQGDVDLPLDGGPDVLRAMALWDVHDDGRLAVRHGDSYLMFAEWDLAGRVSSQSIQPFGAATTRPDSPHYADQAPLFVRKELKPVHFWPSDLRVHAKRAYRP